MYSSYLNQFVDWTQEEVTLGKKFIKWEELSLSWEEIDLHWEEIFILLEVIETIRKGGSGSSFKDYIAGNPWDVSKRKIREELGEELSEKFIKVVCRVNGIDYESTRKSNDEIKISASHIQRVLNAGVKVGLKIN